LHEGKVISSFDLDRNPGNKQESSGRVVVVRDVRVGGLGLLSDSTEVRPARGATWESQWMKPWRFLSQWPSLG